MTDLAAMEAEVAVLAAALKAKRAAVRKAKNRGYMREYRRRPEAKAKNREYQRAYQSQPHVKLRAKLRRGGLSPEQIAAELAREALTGGAG